MQYWEFVVYVCVAFLAPLTFKANSLITEKHCEDMIFAGVMCCFIYASHPCDYPISHRCFICRFAHEHCRIVKHWLFFIHLTLLLTQFVSETLAPKGDGVFWFLFLWIGQILYDIKIWLDVDPRHL